MMSAKRFTALTCVLLGAFASTLGARPSPTADTPGWNPAAAAQYLDGRAEWWATWSNAARDRGTYCMSCHTTLPYALARPALRRPLGEATPSAAEEKILGNLLRRARSWRDVEPWYPDQTRGVPKTSESRAIEAVMNALVLVSRDAPSGRLTGDARTALDVMWTLQMKTGPEAGAWTWLNFKMEPWESPNSPYFGASLAALAVGTAPAHYADSPEIHERVTALRGYFARQHGDVSLLNQLMGLWASSRLPGILAEPQRQSTIALVRARQHEDGGWSTSELGSYTRSDGTESDTQSDGYATALALLALQAAGVQPADQQIANGLAWLRRNQDRNSGRWIAVSPNKQRDPSSDAGRFMSDAATAYAVLALTYER